MEDSNIGGNRLTRRALAVRLAGLSLALPGLVALTSACGAGACAAATAPSMSAQTTAPQAAAQLKAGGTLDVAEVQAPPTPDRNFAGGPRNSAETIFSRIVRPDLTNSAVRPDPTIEWKALDS